MGRSRPRSRSHGAGESIHSEGIRCFSHNFFYGTGLGYHCEFHKNTLQGFFISWLLINVEICMLGMSGCWLSVDFCVFHHRLQTVADAHIFCPTLADPLHFVGRLIIQLFWIDGFDYAANAWQRNGIHSRKWPL
jgi:hypothetical protein